MGKRACERVAPWFPKSQSVAIELVAPIPDLEKLYTRAAISFRSPRI